MKELSFVGWQIENLTLIRFEYIMNVLFLDDCKERTKIFKDGFLWCTTVTTAKEAIEQLEKKSWDFIFLDHDLNEEIYCDSSREDCGMEVVRWIIGNKPIIKKIICHSHNDRARIEMDSTLRTAGYDSKEIPFIHFHQIGIYETLNEIRQRMNAHSTN